MKYYATVEIEVEADEQGEVSSILRNALGQNIAVDTIRDQPSGFFVRAMEIYKEFRKD